MNIIITDAGRAALINAQNTGTGPTEIAQVGLSAASLVPTAADTVLPGEIKRVATLSGDVVAADTIHVAMFDDSADLYSLRSFALYLDDGTLFALYGLAPAVVSPILNKTAESIAALVFDIVFADISAATIIFGDTSFSNPPATTDRRGVVELATVAEAQAGVDALRALTPAGAKAAILGWLIGLDGSGSGLDADTLDGQHGSYYADIAARLGYVPANRAGDTFTGNVTVQADLRTWRTGGLIGFVGLNQAGDRYLLNNGSAYELPGQSLFVNSGIAWTAANDGAGSGMDADLLDGQHGAYYTDIAARLGFTPANRAGDTFTGNVTVQADLTSHRANGVHGVVYLNAAKDRYLFNNGSAYELPGQSLFVNGAIVWTAGNDGAGSGMDADLLDGQHGAYYTDIAARLGYTPLNAASYSAADVLAKLTTVDGSGSGLDADLLDGLNATAFMRAAEPTEIRFGQAAHIDNSGFMRVTFSTPFPTGLRNVVVCNVAAAPPVAFHAVGVGDRFGIDIWSSSSSGSPALAGTAFSWIAIGY